MKKPTQSKYWRIHPLSGSNVSTLLQLLRRCDGLPVSQYPQIAIALLITLGRWPCTTFERLYVAQKRRHCDKIKPPIFIVGHWRSGTTHLYNILSKADFGYLPPLATGMPWDMLGIISLLRPLLERSLPSERYIDNIPVKPDSPQEDEIALANMMPISFYHALYFPKVFDRYFNSGIFFDGLTEQQIQHWQKTFKYFLFKLSLDQQGKQLLIKNPVYTARVAMLHNMFPEAKFIHIHRNPYEVFESMRNFYQKLLRQFSLQPYGHLNIDDIILTTYQRMMKCVIADTAQLPKNTFVELHYTDLVKDPLGQIETVYQQLNLANFETARPKYKAYLDSVKNYQKNRFDYSDQSAKLVEDAWAPFLERWDYSRP